MRYDDAKFRMCYDVPTLQGSRLTRAQASFHVRNTRNILWRDGLYNGYLTRLFDASKQVVNCDSCLDPALSVSLFHTLPESTSIARQTPRSLLLDLTLDGTAFELPHQEHLSRLRDLSQRSRSQGKKCRVKLSTRRVPSNATLWRHTPAFWRYAPSENFTTVETGDIEASIMCTSPRPVVLLTLT